MRGRCDPRRTMDINTDIAVRGQQRGTGMHPNPHTHGSSSKRGLDLSSRLQRPSRGRKGQEGSITFTIDDPAAVRDASILNHLPMHSERLGPRHRA
jgi:hypothetical protein